MIGAYDLFVLLLLLLFLHRIGPILSYHCKLPQITVFLLAGILCNFLGVFTEHATRDLLPLHHAALALITFAAGAELEVTSLQQNARVVLALTACLTGAALLCVFMLGLVFISPGESGAAVDTERWLRTCVGSLLAAVVAIARSPSSAIGVVTELAADGPFTQTMLTLTMLTDVVVIVLFTAACELAELLLHPVAPPGTDEPGLGAAILRFLGVSAVHLCLSAAHGAVLTLLCLLTLRLPAAGTVLRTMLRPLALLCVGGFAFTAERILHALLHGHRVDDFIRLEPMLGCILAGFVLCNYLDVRRPFSESLKRAMPIVLTFFFLTTGMAVDLKALAHSWPAACGLCCARLVSIRFGYSCGLWLLSQDTLGSVENPLRSFAVPQAVSSPSAWLALITQAGVGLGLAEEIGDKFAPWAEGLRTNIVATIVLNQIIGPPLLRYALRQSGETGQSTTLPRDRVVEQLTRRLFATNPKAIATITAAARAAADTYGAVGFAAGGAAAAGGAPSAAEADGEKKADGSPTSTSRTSALAARARGLLRRLTDRGSDTAAPEEARNLLSPNVTIRTKE